MTNIKELRRLAQAATPGPDGVSLNWLKLLQDFQKEANPAAINELLDRLEAAEKDIILKEKIIDSIGSILTKVVNERDELRAKIEEMERQGPVAADINAFRSAFEAALKERNWPATRQGDGYLSPSTQSAWRIAFSTVRRLKLYLAPGAKGE